MNPDSLTFEPAVEQAPQPAPAPTVQPIGLSPVLDIENKEGKVIGHYQWAFHKDGKADSLAVANVVKSHDGTEQVLYKTYAESAIAKKVMEEAAGTLEIKENLATIKLGEQYKNHKGEVSNYGISDLLEFQGIGFVLVLCVLVGLWGLVAFVSYIVKALGLAEPSKAAQSKPLAVSASAAKTIHPGISDEQFVAVVSAAAAHALGGKPVSVVKFRPLNTMDWTWAIQGRVSLHTRKV